MIRLVIFSRCRHPEDFANLPIMPVNGLRNHGKITDGFLVNKMFPFIIKYDLLRIVARADLEMRLTQLYHCVGV